MKTFNQLELLFRLCQERSLYILMQEYSQDEHQQQYLHHFYFKINLKKEKENH